MAHVVGTPVVLLVHPGIVPVGHKVQQHEHLHKEEACRAHARHPACTAVPSLESGALTPTTYKIPLRP